MKTDLTREQIDAYQRDGCLIIKDFLTTQELDELISAVSESVKQLGKWRVGGDEDKIHEEGDTYFDHVFLQKMNLWKINDTVKGYFLDPKLGEMLCKLEEGIDGIRVWHDQSLQKAPWANPTAWHTDNPYFSFYSPHVISIWVALDDATLQNGCMYYLPGTHKLENYDEVTDWENIGGYFEAFPQFKDVEPIPAVMKAGDVGFHNGLTSHGAGPNMTPHWRRAMTCNYMPDGSTFNGIPNILSKEQMSRLKVGDVLDDDARNPLIWSREKSESVV